MAAVTGALPVIEDLLQQPNLNAKTAIKAVLIAAFGAAYSFFRLNPPPELDINPVTPPPKP